jgi:hypothetical protein
MPSGLDIAIFQMASVPSYRRYAEEPDHASIERADPKADADREGCHNVDRTGTQTIPTLIGSAEEFGATVLAASVIAPRLGLVTPLSAGRTSLLQPQQGRRRAEFRPRAARS